MLELNSKIKSNRRNKFFSMLALGALIILGGCTTTAPTADTDGETSETTSSSEDSLMVVTTFLPMTQFTNAVAGDRAEVVQLMPTNVGPHDYQAKPSDVQALVNADVLVKNGLEMEFFLDGLIENAENSDLVIIDSSEEIVALANDDHDDHADHEDHDDHDHEKHEDHEDHAEHDDHDHADHEDHDDHGHVHAHGEFDPHIWLDPKRAIEQVENIRDGLIAADPEGEAEYTANAAAFIAELEALDAEIAEMLSPYAGQTFVVFHDFANYFSESYDVQSEVLVELPEENPSPEDVKRVIETVKAEGLTTIMAEPQAVESSFEVIAQDLGVGLSEFDSLEVGPSDSIQPEYYLTTMRQNAENLANSFGASTQSLYPLWTPLPMATLGL